MLSRALVGAAADSFLNRQPPADETSSAEQERENRETGREHKSSSEGKIEPKQRPSAAVPK